MNKCFYVIFNQFTANGPYKASAVREMLGMSRGFYNAGVRETTRSDKVVQQPLFEPDIPSKGKGFEAGFYWRKILSAGLSQSLALSNQPRKLIATVLDCVEEAQIKFEERGSGPRIKVLSWDPFSPKFFHGQSIGGLKNPSQRFPTGNIEIKWLEQSHLQIAISSCIEKGSTYTVQFFFKIKGKEYIRKEIKTIKQATETMRLAWKQPAALVIDIRELAANIYKNALTIIQRESPK